VTEPKLSRSNRGRLLIVAAAILWSLGGVVAKGLTPLNGVTIAFYRSLFAGLALLPFIPRTKWTIRPAMFPIVVIFGTMVGLYLSAISLTTAANAILLQYSCVFWTVPLGILFLKERLDRQSLVASLVASAGIAAIVVFGRKGTSGEGLGIAYGLASGMGYATVIVAFRAMRDVDSGWLSAVCNLGGAATLGIYAMVATPGLMRPSAGQLPVLAAFGVIQMAIPYLLFAKGLQTVSAAEAGLLSLLEPVLTPIWVTLAHGETPARFTIVGGAILLAGVAIRYVRPGLEKPQPVPIHATQERKTGRSE
jgi:DME family drug/metabolite transporter